MLTRSITGVAALCDSLGLCIIPTLVAGCIIRAFVCQARIVSVGKGWLVGPGGRDNMRLPAGSKRQTGFSILCNTFLVVKHCSVNRTDVKQGFERE